MLDQPTETHGEGVAPEFREAETLLEVNNIEVIYNHVILVLEGGQSLKRAARAGSPRFWGATARARRPR
jgi:hypothetical protein